MSRTPSPSVQARLVEAGGIRLHAERCGTGSPLLVLHGFTGSTRTMQGLIEPLSRHHDCVAVDLPGHGRSEAPGAIAPYRLERVAAALVRVLDAFGIERSHLLGYSMGGRVALGLAALHPERVLSAAVIGASAGLADPRERSARRRDDEALARFVLERGVEAFVDRWMQHPLFATQRRLGDAFWQRARNERLANRPQGLAFALRGLGPGAQPPLHERLRKLERPVALLAGELDTKFLRIARELAALLPRGRVIPIEDAGHAAHLERPEAVVAALRSFFAECDTEREGSARPAHRRIPPSPRRETP